MSTFFLYVLLTAYLLALGEAVRNLVCGTAKGPGLAVYLSGTVLLSIGLIMLTKEAVK
jgi:hypothetical protein